MVDSRPLIYFVYGLPNSGRRKIIFDLIEGGVPSSEKVLYLRPKDADPSTFDEQIESLVNVEALGWELKNCEIIHKKISKSPKIIVILAPGVSNPADCAEALNLWADHNHYRIGRLITVVHCSFLAKQPKARSWYEACIHFSDIVLLNRRDGIDNHWMKDFINSYRKTFNPVRILIIKKGYIRNPLEVLDPQARRLSLYFDELIPLEEDEFDNALKPEDTKPDLYIQRLENGQRAKPIPDIGKLL